MSPVTAHGVPLKDGKRSILAMETATVSDEVREGAIPEEDVVIEDYSPLFEDESENNDEEPSAEEGVEETTEKNETEESAPEDEKEQEKPEEEQKEEEKEEKPEAWWPGKDDGKPPEGYVKHEALHSERRQRQSLQTEIDNLKAELLEIQSKGDAPKDEWADFKRLSDDEYKELAEDDPTAAALYLRREKAYDDYQRQVSDSKRAKEQYERKLNEMVTAGAKKMEEVIPGFYEDTPESEKARKELSEFALNNGFENHHLVWLTTPSTRIVYRDSSGQDRVAVLGDAAPAIVKMLHDFKAAKDSKLTEEQIAKIREDERLKATEEITKKVKKEPDFRSLGDLPGGGDVPDDFSPTTEEDWAKLPKETRRRLLGG